jgi:hypothetical protein
MDAHTKFHLNRSTLFCSKQVVVMVVWCGVGLVVATAVVAVVDVIKTGLSRI